MMKMMIIIIILNTLIIIVQRNVSKHKKKIVINAPMNTYQIKEDVNLLIEKNIIILIIYVLQII